MRDYIRKLVGRRVSTGMPDADTSVHKDLVERFTQHFFEVFDNINLHVTELFHEPVANNEERDAFVHTKLKQRCFELFNEFDPTSQEALLETVDEFILADGHLHPAETKFRSELAQLLETDVEVELKTAAPSEPPPVAVTDVRDYGLEEPNHPFFNQFEHHYSSDPDTISKQVAADLLQVDEAIETLETQRRGGEGQLAGKSNVQQLAASGAFLDGYVYHHPVSSSEEYELTVLGDLHGCYSCLKAAVMQTRFFEKVAAYQRDPKNNPHPKLVLLGDYIDRGIFSLNGVLRAAMQLFIRAPEHVYMLRGNHEYYLEYKGQIFGGVKPAEAINTLKPHLPVDVFRKYMALFEMLPNMLLFGRHLFVHGGIPRSKLTKERWKDLSTLNDPDVRFQMMWSDPSAADVIPAALQEQTARFPFGRLQFQAFMERIGCHTMVRGHEKIDEGFKRNYDDPRAMLITLFSAGGKDNSDLPEKSSYRNVTPMALTIRIANGKSEITPFRLNWSAYNDPDHNAFFKAPPEIEHRVE